MYEAVGQYLLLAAGLVAALVGVLSFAQNADRFDVSCGRHPRLLRAAKWIGSILFFGLCAMILYVQAPTLPMERVPQPGCSNFESVDRNFPRCSERMFIATGGSCRRADVQWISPYARRMSKRRVCTELEAQVAIDDA